MNAIIETAIKKIYLTAEQPDVAAVIEEVQLKCFNAKTETSSAADPATDFRHSQIMCFRSHSICAEQPIFANNLRLYIMSGQLTAPGLPEPTDKEVVKTLVNTYGKTWHTWHYDRYADLPLGVPQLMMGFTQPGQAQASFICLFLRL